MQHPKDSMENTMDATLHDIPTQRTCPFDPPPEYRHLRVEQPILRVKTPRGDSTWLVTRYKDIRAVLSDKRFSSDPRRPGFPSYLTGDIAPPPGFFLLMDDADHKRLRALIVGEFIGPQLEALNPLMQSVVARNMAVLESLTPPQDLITTFALPIAAQVICELLGVPYADHGFVQERTDTILDRSRSPEEQEAAVVELMGYFDQQVTLKENAPGNDLIGRLIQDPARYSQVSHDELVGLAALLLLSAYDTMAQVIGLGTVVLLQQPEQLKTFLEEPALADNFIDEMVRYLSVNHTGLPRVATADVEIGGQLIRAGEGVVVMLNSGNRDELIYTQPDQIDIHRKARNHLGFGHGLHKCIGAHFARAELKIVFRSLFKQLPTLALTCPIDTLPFRHEMVLYGLKQLPITWTDGPRQSATEPVHSTPAQVPPNEATRRGCPYTGSPL